MLTQTDIQKLRDLVAKSLIEIKDIRLNNPMLLDSDSYQVQLRELYEYATGNTSNIFGKGRSVNNLLFNLPNNQVGKISKADDEVFQIPSKVNKISANQDSKSSTNNSNLENPDKPKSSMYDKKRETNLTKLLQALLDITKNKNDAVKSTLNLENIKSTEHGIQCYSQKIHEYFEICLENPCRESINNFIRLLCIIGEFTDTRDCTTKFNKKLNEFEANKKYKRFLRFGRILYQIWHPYSDTDLLKMGEFGLYWLDKLTKDNIEYLMMELH
jgi:hypothetical protein